MKFLFNVICFRRMIAITLYREVPRITMIKNIATLLLIADMALGLFVWLEDHDNTRLRVIRLGSVIAVAVILLVIIFLFDG